MPFIHLLSTQTILPPPWASVTTSQIGVLLLFPHHLNSRCRVILGHSYVIMCDLCWVLSAWAWGIWEISEENLISDAQWEVMLILYQGRAPRFLKCSVRPIFKGGPKTWKKGSNSQSRTQRFVRSKEPFLLRISFLPNCGMLGSLVQS